MKKIFIVLFLCIFFISNSVAAMTTNEYVNALESKMFGVTYQNQPMDKRIDRIEMQIYDKNYSGSNEERLEKIDKIYPKKEFEIGSDTSLYSQKNDLTNYQKYIEAEEPADYNDYPVVSEIEQSIYKKNYSGEDIYKRLSRIETELYGNVKSEHSLQDRVENLKSILPKKSTNKITSSNFEFNTPMNFNNNSNGYFETNSSIGQLELQTFNRTFTNDNMQRRIERLEQFYFGDSSIDKSDDDRITRLASVVLTNKSFDAKTQNAAQWAGIFVNLLMIGLGFLL